VGAPDSCYVTCGITTLAFNKDILFGGSSDGTVIGWNMNTREQTFFVDLFE